MYDLGREIEVALVEPEGLALAQAQSKAETEVDSELVALLQLRTNRAHGLSQPHLRLLLGSLRCLDRSMDLYRVPDEPLVVDGDVEDGGEVSPDHLGGRSFYA